MKMPSEYSHRADIRTKDRHNMKEHYSVRLVAYHDKSGNVQTVDTGTRIPKHKSNANIHCL
jgi:hypothetical protein